MTKNGSEAHRRTAAHGFGRAQSTSIDSEWLAGWDRADEACPSQLPLPRALGFDADLEGPGAWLGFENGEVFVTFIHNYSVNPQATSTGETPTKNDLQLLLSAGVTPD